MRHFFAEHPVIEANKKGLVPPDMFAVNSDDVQCEEAILEAFG